MTAFRRATSRISGTSDASEAPPSLLFKPKLLVGKVVTQLIVLGQFRSLPRGLAGDPVLCCLLARADRLHVPDDPAPEDDHRAFRPGIARSEQRPLDCPDESCRLAAESPRGSQNGIPLRTPCGSDDPLSRAKKLHTQLGQTDLFVRHGDFLSHGYVLFLTRAVVSSFNGRRVRV